MNWQAIQALTIGPDDAHHLTVWQMCVRGAVIFLMGIFYIRAVGPRTFGRNTPLDIVVSVVIGSNLSRAMTGSSAFVPTLAGTYVLVALHWIFAWATRHSHRLGLIVKGDPLDLIRDGRVDRAQMRKQNISDQDLDEELRSHGVERPEQVKLAVLERSGKLSIIKAEG